MPDPQTPQDFIRQQAREIGVPEALALGVAEQESSFRPLAVGEPFKLPNGATTQAYGMYQVIPETAVKYGADPHDPLKSVRDPVENVRIGLRYLKSLHDQYGGDLDRVLATYGGVRTDPTYVPGTTAKILAWQQRLGTAQQTGAAMTQAPGSGAAGMRASTLGEQHPYINAAIEAFDPHEREARQNYAGLIGGTLGMLGGPVVAVGAAAGAGALENALIEETGAGDWIGRNLPWGHVNGPPPPPDSTPLSRTAEAAAWQGGGELFGQGVARGVKNIGKRFVQSRIAKDAFNYLAKQKSDAVEALKNGVEVLTQKAAELSSQRNQAVRQAGADATAATAATNLAGQQEVKEVARQGAADLRAARAAKPGTMAAARDATIRELRAARARAAEVFKRSQAQGQAGVAQVGTDYASQLPPRPPSIDAGQSVIDVVEGPARDAYGALGRAVDEAADAATASGRKVDYRPLKEEATRIARTELLPPEQAFPRVDPATAAHAPPAPPASAATDQARAVVEQATHIGFMDKGGVRRTPAGDISWTELIPSTRKSALDRLQRGEFTVSQVSQAGDVVQVKVGEHTYHLKVPEGFDLAAAKTGAGAAATDAAAAAGDDEIGKLVAELSDKEREALKNNPAMHVIGRILRAADEGNFKDAHLWKSQLQAAIRGTYDEVQRGQVQNITMHLASKLRQALSGDAGYDAATAAYEAASPAFTEHVAQTIRRVARDSPEAIVELLNPDRPSHARTLVSLLTEYAEKGGGEKGAEAGREALDKVRGAWFHEHVLKGPVETLGERLAALRDKAEFTDAVFGDDYKPVFENLDQIVKAYKDKVLEAASLQTSAKMQGKHGVEVVSDANRAELDAARQRADALIQGKRTAAVSARDKAAEAAAEKTREVAARGKGTTEAVRRSGEAERVKTAEELRAARRKVQSRKAGLSGTPEEAEERAFAESSLAGGGLRRPEQVTADLMHAVLLGPKNVFGGLSWGRTMVGASDADILRFAAYSKARTAAVVAAIKAARFPGVTSAIGATVKPARTLHSEQEATRRKRQAAEEEKRRQRRAGRDGGASDLPPVNLPQSGPQSDVVRTTIR